MLASVIVNCALRYSAWRHVSEDRSSLKARDTHTSRSRFPLVQMQPLASYLGERVHAGPAGAANRVLPRLPGWPAAADRRLAIRHRVAQD